MQDRFAAQNIPPATVYRFKALRLYAQIDQHHLWRHDDDDVTFVPGARSGNKAQLFRDESQPFCVAGNLSGKTTDLWATGLEIQPEIVNILGTFRSIHKTPQNISRNHTSPHRRNIYDSKLCSKYRRIYKFRWNITNNFSRLVFLPLLCINVWSFSFDFFELMASAASVVRYYLQLLYKLVNPQNTYKNTWLCHVFVFLNARIKYFHISSFLSNC